MVGISKRKKKWYVMWIEKREQVKKGRVMEKGKQKYKEIEH